MPHIVLSRRAVRRPLLGIGALLSLVIASGALYLRAQSAPPVAGVPGALTDGSTLLPNGWRLAPAGRHVALSDLPTAFIQSPDGRYLIATNNGLAKPSLSVVDVNAWAVKSTTSLDGAWLGLAWHPDGTRLYSSGASLNTVQEFAYGDGVLTRARTFALPARTGETFAGGLAVSPDGRRLFATRLFAMTLSSIDLATGLATNTVDLPSEPYTVVVSPDNRLVYVSLWGGAAVQVYDAASLTLLQELPTGAHPNALLLSSDGRRLFVACGSSASVWVYETTSFTAVEQISTNLYPDAPPTATPNSLALSPDGQTLLVANADYNAVVVVDVSNAVHSFVSGFIPTGWYPTGAMFSRDGKQVFVLSGKGLASSPNLTNSGMERRLVGAVSTLPVPDRTALAEYTRQVYALTPYSDAIRLAPANVPIGSPIPRTVGASSPIKHVFYVIRENRTYDQVLGDLPGANGAPQLTLFGKDVTPNGHALAQTFATFDNFYADADVSADGHAYSTAAYATDFIVKTWQTFYAQRGGLYLTEGGGFMRTPFGNIAGPPQGHLWDYAHRAGLRVRSYGEFVANVTKTAAGDVTAVETVPGLHDAVAPAFAGWDLDITDNKRVDAWQQEFQGYVANGNLPSLSIIRLPSDHTAATRPGSLTPRAMVADNDVALGRVVEAIAASPYWQDSAIFILEDDAQAGPDHVDSHRSVLLVASPFARRGVVDHTFYTTSGVLRTMELILGLPPMSQYDAAATPMYNAFTGSPNLAAYRRTDAPRVPLDERNLPSALGAAQSMAMDLSEADRVPDALLNEILWHAVKGAASPMPPPRRSVFARSTTIPDDDDDE